MVVQYGAGQGNREGRGQGSMHLRDTSSISLFPAVDLCTHSDAHMLVRIGVPANHRGPL